jgi:hypothetical protein
MASIFHAIVDRLHKLHNWIDAYPKVNTTTVFDTFWVRALLGVIITFATFPILIIPFIIYTLYQYFYGEKGIKRKERESKREDSNDTTEHKNKTD